MEETVRLSVLMLRIIHIDHSQRPNISFDSKNFLHILFYLIINLMMFHTKSQNDAGRPPYCHRFICAISVIHAFVHTEMIWQSAIVMLFWTLTISNLRRLNKQIASWYHALAKPLLGQVVGYPFQTQLKPKSRGISMAHVSLVIFPIMLMLSCPL